MVNQYLANFKAAQVARTPDEIRRSATIILEHALREAVWCESSMQNAKTLMVGSLPDEFPIRDLDPKASKEDLKDLLVGLALYKGTYKPKHYWLNFKGNIYVAFPTLIQSGVGGAVEWALAQSISDYIRDGDKSSLMEFIENAGFSLERSQEKYFFGKGYTLLSDRDSALKAKRDIAAVIGSMALSRDSKAFRLEGSMEFFKLRKAKSA
jgi:hypothetical protein